MLLGPSITAAILWTWLLPRGFLLGPSITAAILWTLVITKMLSTDISSIVDVALSDHNCGLFTALLPIAQGNTEHTIKKHYLTSEVARDFIECMNDTPPPILPYSCDNLVEDFNNK
jgi:hypothetical protein